MVDNCNIIKIPREWGIKRTPARPEHLRLPYMNGLKFEENFDYDTLYYDVVELNPKTILFIGPPLYDMKQFVKDNCTVVDQNNKEVNFIMMDLERLGAAEAKSSRKISKIKINPGNIIIKPKKPCRDFDDKICMVTLQKNNPISWIKQWISYHKENHGVNGFIIYDNGSTDYSLETLENSLQTDNVTIKIVNWPVLYGPQGIDCDTHNTWDSDFAQSGMLEHVKRLYVPNAKLVINADIDELLVIEKGNLEQVIKDIESDTMYCYVYEGKWIEPFDIKLKKPAIEISPDQRLFEDYYCVDITNKRSCGRKWMLIPSKTSKIQWCAHKIEGEMRKHPNIHYAHFMAMNTGWSRERADFTGDHRNLMPDMYLLNNFNIAKKRRESNG